MSSSSGKASVSSSSKISVSSSSEITGSSSSKAVWAYLNPAISYGKMKDSRDNQVYKTVVIGTQTWMAENLNYKVDSSWCYMDSAGYCEKYGRLYQWGAAMDLDVAYNSKMRGGSEVDYQGICPSGWHIPDTTEWQTLHDYVEANNGDDSVATSLKSTSGWDAGDDGTDAFGFSALPVGWRDDDGGFERGISKSSRSEDGTYGIYFWTSTEYEGYSEMGVDWELENSGSFSMNGKFRARSLSLRCVMTAD
ncbi:MAG: fibrobacter succinogenes major paralogous domain-containing protein [Fibrobacteraceae bacterium]|nr:fibrobacter succinogenes major paralogous domain-containing protein [Fibrobacteraceae bacterium]